MILRRQYRPLSSIGETVPFMHRDVYCVSLNVGLWPNEVTRGRRWRTIARVTSGHSVFEQANDRFTYKTGYLPVDGTKLSVKDRFRMGRSGTPYPLWSFAQQT